ncbi:hypothetical protein ACH5RR_013731 [Cinchona calisaya]|uniref:Uncharacterized protein n=1 Tax=Cinchona calisaya TaxID=153742 RepID=A0ABD3A0U5_9GENT
MLRALSTRNCRGYEKLKDQENESSALLEAKLNRARSLPAKIFSSARKSTREQSAEAKSSAKQAKKVSKIHPVFNLFHPRLRKKAAAKPEFSRYLEYLKEGGLFGMDSNMPVIQGR